MGQSLKSLDEHGSILADMLPILYYVHDPMCSWCWAFQAVYSAIQQQLKDKVQHRRLLGGLATDNLQAMPTEMQHYLLQTWRTIQERVPGVQFNFDFWTVCQPRRSTWPACRAVIAARQQGEGNDKLMTVAIQTAYYRQARNPSDDDILIQLAAETGLDVNQFTHDLYDTKTQQQLDKERTLCQQLNVDSFPALVLDRDGSIWRIPIDYNNASSSVELIKQLLEDDND